MFEGLLSDLDELALTVRNKNSRDYISEAIANYRARSFRSAISAVWVAVTYDIISKIRELAQQGDAAAQKYTAGLDAAIALGANDSVTSKKRLQIVENEILDVAKSVYEFLSPHEYRDMERLREDRNLCSHPAFVEEDILFQPTPDLVRTHVVNAIIHLLQHPPIQGKSALAKLKIDILQPSFPTTQTSVSEFMDARYLTHIRTGTLDNFVAVFLKVLIKQSDADLMGREEIVMMCLVALQRRHIERCDSKIRHDLPRLTDSAQDDDLKRAMRLFRVERRCWAWLETPIKLRIFEIVKRYDYSKNDLDCVAGCLEIDELRPIFADRVATFTMIEKQELYSRYPHQVFANDAILLYRNSASFRVAEDRFEKLIRPFIGTYGAEHIQQVLEAASFNGQIYAAAETPDQITGLLDSTLDLAESTKAVWREFDAKMTKIFKAEGGYERLHLKLQEFGLLASTGEAGS